MSVSERVIELKNATKEKSLRSFALGADIPYNTLRSALERNKNVSETVILKLVKKYNCDENWLRKGVGTMFPSAQGENKDLILNLTDRIVNGERSDESIYQLRDMIYDLVSRLKEANGTLESVSTQLRKLTNS